MAADLRKVYAPQEVPLGDAAIAGQEATMSLNSVAQKWDSQYPQIAKSWRDNWAGVTPFFAYAPEIRKVILALKEVTLGVRLMRLRA